MIIPEYILRDIFKQIPAIEMGNANNTPFFHWGDKQELVKYIKTSESKNYPLIWLLPTVDYHYEYGTRCSKRLELVIATLETNESLFNTSRYDKSFRIVLNPLANQVVKGLTDSKITKIIDAKWEIFKHPKYSDDGGKTNATIDKWDALKITFDKVIFDDGCLYESIYL